VGARHRPEGEDQRHERAGGGEGVLQQLEADVVGEVLGHDARPDDGRQQEGRPDELADRSADVR